MRFAGLADSAGFADSGSLADSTGFASFAGIARFAPGGILLLKMTLPHYKKINYLRGTTMAKKAQTQLQFKTHKDYTRTEHGGGLRTGARKLVRPLAIKSPMHIVLRSSRAKGTRSMLSKAYFPRVTAIVFKFAKSKDVHIAQFANVGNHLHLLVQARTKSGFQRFLRTITGLIARLIMGAVKGRPSGKFWDNLAFSRVVNWDRD